MTVVGTPTVLGSVAASASVRAATRDALSGNDSATVTTTILQPPPQCSNGVDDDGDSRADSPNDPGCSASTDETEAPDPYACEPSYPTVCIRLRSEVGDLSCADIPFRRFVVRHDVTPADPHGFDGNSDGVGCES